MRIAIALLLIITTIGCFTPGKIGKKRKIKSHVGYFAPRDRFAYYEVESDFYTVNIYIQNFNTGQGSLLFQPGQLPDDHSIADIFFESGYDEKNKRILFNGERSWGDHYRSGPTHTKNNQAIEPRDLGAQLLVVTRQKDTGIMAAGDVTLWVAGKDGTSLKKLTTVDKKGSFHINVGEQLITKLSPRKGSVKVDHFGWK